MDLTGRIIKSGGWWIIGGLGSLPVRFHYTDGILNSSTSGANSIFLSFVSPSHSYPSLFLSWTGEAFVSLIYSPRWNAWRSLCSLGHKLSHLMLQFVLPSNPDNPCPFPLSMSTRGLAPINGRTSIVLDSSCSLPCNNHAPRKSSMPLSSYSTALQSPAALRYSKYY